MKIAVCILSIAFMLWCGASYIEIISKNAKPDPQYSSWNALQIMVNMKGSAINQ